MWDRKKMYRISEQFTHPYFHDGNSLCLFYWRETHTVNMRKIPINCMATRDRKKLTQRTPYEKEIDEIYILRWKRSAVIFQPLFTITRSSASTAYIYFHVDSLLFAFVACRQCNSYRIEEEQMRIKKTIILPKGERGKKNADDAPKAYEVRD